MPSYCSAYKICTVFSIYTSLQAGRDHIERRLTFLLQFGWSLDWHREVVVSLWASYNFVTIITSQISLATYSFMLNVFDVNKFMTSKVPALQFPESWTFTHVLLTINKKPSRHYLLRHQGFFNWAGRIRLPCGHLVSTGNPNSRCYGIWKAKLDPHQNGQTPTQTPLAFYYRIDLIPWWFF